MSVKDLVRNEPVRVYAYGVMLAVIALLVFYGILTAVSAPLWIALATALLTLPAVEKARSAVTPVNPAPTNLPTEGTDD